ncbi:clarin-3 [Canis lupus baileyi]|uniref:Clarin 3 n=3 Tax=Canis lupus TaxID=9612 RepID=A0A8C0TIZ8_CANLF|nr:clarin-3 [Canis lupus dingo]XP_038296852.1 clarin-3 [Canis lupus familiaris]XP_038435038.1 clarin-3 [Canis lupus familiaris]XP_854375.1 clarin-3 [Canis lupus familiaris]|eukprot:XP_854375.1 clarin-3 [Canis lupus familiaris]
MPTTKKILMFLSSFLTSFGAFIVVCSMLGTQEWVSSRIAISDSSSNGSLIVTYGLFRGKSRQEFSHGLEESDKDFGVLEKLNTSSQRTLHLVTILFLVLSLCASLLSSGLTFYNSISNPYQTFLGPVGVYTWSGLGAFLIFVAMILFVGNTQSNHLSKELAQTLYPVYPAATYGGATHSYGYSFWLTLLVILLNVVTVVIIFFFQKARYQRKQEERKPMESAPRDGILF